MPVDAELVGSDDDLGRDLQLGALDGLDVDEFLRDLERVFGIRIAPDEAQALRTLRQRVVYVDQRLPPTSLIEPRLGGVTTALVLLPVPRPDASRKPWVGPPGHDRPRSR